MSKAYKKLGRVADGRIRKNWPTGQPLVLPFAKYDTALSRELARTKGFENSGVLCFRNAVVQCLLHVPEFIHYLLSPERCTREVCHDPGFTHYLLRRKKCMKEQPQDPEDEDDPTPCVFCALRGLALEYWTSTSDEAREEKLGVFWHAMTLHPTRCLADHQNQGYPALTPGQQDCHEFFTSLIHMLHYANNDWIDKVESVAVENVAVDRLFEMKVKRHWTCDDCGLVTPSREALTGMQVMMPRTPLHQRNLDHYVRQYFADEHMRIRCDSAVCRGRNKQRARNTRISSGPEILVIQMGRFRYNVYGQREKVYDQIKYGEFLDLSPYTGQVPGHVPGVTHDKMALRYRLHGVVSHKGEGADDEGGHYVATVRCRNGVDFACANDSTVNDLPAHKEEYLKEAECYALQSYLLVYQKVGGKMAKRI